MKDSLKYMEQNGIIFWKTEQYKRDDQNDNFDIIDNSDLLLKDLGIRIIDVPMMRIKDIILKESSKKKKKREKIKRHRKKIKLRR